MDANILLRHADDLAAQAAKSGYAATKFLAPGEAFEVIRHFARRPEIDTAAEGGFTEAERVRVVLVNASWGKYRREDIISAVRTSYRAQDELCHRDILGALMNLGVKRETVGDIMVCPEYAIIICVPELAEYIAQNLIKIGRAGVSAGPLDIGLLPEKQENIVIKSFTVSSLRLDCIISGLYNMSRKEASGLIAQGLVKIGHIECQKQEKELNEGEVFSVRGMGKARLVSIEGKTRKDRIRVKVGMYK